MDPRLLMVKFWLTVTVAISTIIKITLLLLLCFFIIVDYLELNLRLWSVSLLFVVVLELLERVVMMQTTSIYFHIIVLHSISFFHGRVYIAIGTLRAHYVTLTLTLLHSRSRWIVLSKYFWSLGVLIYTGGLCSFFRCLLCFLLFSKHFKLLNFLLFCL